MVKWKIRHSNIMNNKNIKLIKGTASLNSNAEVSFEKRVGKPF